MSDHPHRRSFLTGFGLLVGRGTLATVLPNKTAPRPTMSSQSRVRLAREVAVDSFGETIALHHPRIGSCALNETAGRALALVDGSRSVGDIADLVAAEFDAPVATVRRDIVDILHRLLVRGFLEVS